MLERLIYSSKSTSDIITNLSIAIIVGEAERNNRRDDITGVLLTIDQDFVQVLEGEKNDLDRLLMRLKADRRHTDLEVLDRGQASRRLFGNWSMMASQIDPFQRDDVQAIVRLAAVNPLQAAQAFANYAERLRRDC